MTWPIGLVGIMSPYPTVEIVWNMNQIASKRLPKFGSQKYKIRVEARTMTMKIAMNLSR